MGVYVSVQDVQPLPLSQLFIGSSVLALNPSGIGEVAVIVGLSPTHITFRLPQVAEGEEKFQVIRANIADPTQSFSLYRLDVETSRRIFRDYSGLGSLEPRQPVWVETTWGENGGLPGLVTKVGTTICEVEVMGTNGDLWQFYLDDGYKAGPAAYPDDAIAPRLTTLDFTKWKPTTPPGAEGLISNEFIAKYHYEIGKPVVYHPGVESPNLTETTTATLLSFTAGYLGALISFRDESALAPMVTREVRLKSSAPHAPNGGYVTPIVALQGQTITTDVVGLLSDYSQLSQSDRAKFLKSIGDL